MGQNIYPNLYNSPFKKEVNIEQKPPKRSFYFRHKRIIKIGIFFILLALVYWKYFIYIDIKNGCFITISPSILELSNSVMKKGLQVLKYGAPEDYAKVCQHVNKINPNISCAGFGGGCFQQNSPKTIDISTSNRSILWTSLIIVHETCHVIQFQTTGKNEEGPCYEAMDNTMAKLVIY